MTEQEYKREYARQWRLNNPEKVKASNEKRRQKRFDVGDPHYEQNRQVYIDRASKYYQANKEKILKKHRERHLRKSYGLTTEEYQAMVQQQNNCCAICGKEEIRRLPDGNLKPLSVDHCHVTGEVRALLCNDCNATIGFAKDDITILQNAIKYLQKFGVENRRY